MPRARLLKLGKKNIIIASSLLIIVVLIPFALKIKFFLGEPLHITMSPKDLGLYMLNGEEREIIYTIGIENFPSCRADCTLRLHNFAKGELIEQEFSIKYRGTVKKKLLLQAPSRGEGSLGLRYEVICENHKSFYCPSSNEKHIASSFISIIYNRTQEENLKKSAYERYLQNTSLLLQSAIGNLSSLEYFNELSLKLNSSQNFLQSSEDIINVRGEISSINDTIEDSKRSFKESRFDDAIETLSFAYIQLTRLSGSANRINSKISEDLESYNRGIEILNSIEPEKINEAHDLYYKLSFNQTEHGYLESLSRVIKLEARLNSIQDLIQINPLQAEGIIMNISSEYTEIISRFMNDSENLISSGKNMLENYSRFILVGGLIPIDNERPNASLCGSIQNITYLLEEQNRKSSDYSPENQTISNYISSLVEDINSGKMNLTQSSDMNRYLKIDIRPLKNIERILCSNETSFFIWNLSLTGISYSEPRNYAQVIDFPTVVAKCCYNNSCEKCCSNDCDIYPILFLHGHSFDEAVSPEASLRAFGQIMELFEKEGYINVGEIQQGSTPIDWSLFNRPIVARGTYYYINYIDFGINTFQSQKSERIENYALRLNEIILTTIQRTGAEKVDIVAYSMGGLVAREYLKLFGESRVRSLVTIATPHNGIEGMPQRLCTLRGAAKECADMSKGSIFLKRLDSFQPSIPIYTITATGCKMDNGQGDGIVLSSDSTLNYSINYIINGSCTDFFESNLHTEIINPEKYPITFEILKEILIKP